MNVGRRNHHNPSNSCVRPIDLLSAFETNDLTTRLTHRQILACSRVLRS